jgi:hypothetical protein
MIFFCYSGNPGVIDVTLGHSPHYSIFLGYVLLFHQFRFLFFSFFTLVNFFCSMLAFFEVIFEGNLIFLFYRYVNSMNGKLANHEFGEWSTSPFKNYMFQVIISIS